MGLLRYFYWKPLLIAHMEKILSNKKGWLLSGYYSIPSMTNSFLQWCPGTNLSSQLKHSPCDRRSCILSGINLQVAGVFVRLRLVEGRAVVVLPQIIDHHGLDIF
jgi:hypothetical protein